MATIAGQNPYVERRTGERRRVSATLLAREGTDGLRVSWGGVWAGVLVTIGGLVLLGALGVAVGMTAMDPSRFDPNRVAAVAGIWGAAALLASLFLGGMVATRIGMVYDRATGMFEGVLVWVLSMLVMAALAGSGLGLVPDLTIELGTSRTAAWIGVAGMVLALAAAVSGAMTGRRGAAQRVGRE
jgi:hypothetical protein